MDFHSLVAAHLPLAHRCRPDARSEDRYYRSAPDLSSLVHRAIARIAVAAEALVVHLFTRGPA